VACLRSPWFSGLFYLTLVVVIIVLLLITGNVLALWALPIVVVAAALLVSIVGALQMRQDDRLSERGFVRLMGDVFRRLPLLLARAKAAETPKD
jgi:4-hydroxybenzoate polyprenyltransferase